MENQIIEPCCAERQLPQLLRSASGNNVTFTTSGDVTLSNFMKAISGMPGGVHQEITICAPSISRQVLSQLGYKIKMKWADKIRLVTEEPLDAADIQSLIGRSGLDIKEIAESGVIELAADPVLSFSFLGYRGKNGSVYLCGHLMSAADNKTHLYVAKRNCHEGESDYVQKLIDSRIKLHKYDIQSVQEVAAEAPAEEAAAGETESAE